MSVAGPLGRNLENVMKMQWTEVCDDSSQLADTDMRRPTVILPDFLLGKIFQFLHKTKFDFLHSRSTMRQTL